METIEASGKSVDEAVKQALASLGKRRDEVEIIVLQEPSRGAFGLVSKDARVRVTVRSAPVSSGANAIITPEMADAILGPQGDFPEEESYDEDGEEFEDDEFDEEELELEDEMEVEEPTPFFSSPVGVAPAEIADLAEVSAVSGEMQDVEKPSSQDVDITVDVLQHILHYMNIRATVQVRSTDPLTLNILGINENLGLLIGRRGETLAALQLLVSLIVGHRTKHRMRIIVDAESYRERREENLRSLALRVAQQVRNYRRSIALEAMPPHERRIVHIALSDSKDISTESIGEGEERRVVISLKRPGRA